MNTAGIEACAFGTDEFVKQQRITSKYSVNFSKEVESAKASALRMLGRRSHARKELRKKLEDRGHHLAAIDEALDALAHVGLQSDREFAETFARSKWRQVKWGPDKIKTELHHRGISMDIAEEGIEAAFGGASSLNMKRFMDEELEEHATVPHLLSSAEASLLDAAQQRWATMEHLAMHARRRRLVGWLQRRGHSWDNISLILKHLEGRK